MWPLSFVLLIAAAGPQQSSGNLGGAYVGRIPHINNVQSLRGHDLQKLGVSPGELQVRNDCYTIRSYHFERQDGNAPVLTGMTTCTPARILEQKRVSPSRGLYVPMNLQPGGQKQPE
jgi:hypothetical protein